MGLGFMDWSASGQGRGGHEGGDMLSEHVGTVPASCHRHLMNVSERV